jgi:hypothetical protein
MSVMVIKNSTTGEATIHRTGYKDELDSGISITAICCGVVLLIFGISFLLSGVQGFYNPEYYAIAKIIELLRGQ